MLTARPKKRKPAWFLYLVRCGDGSLYTGVSTDPARRLKEHGKGRRRAAKYLRGRGPLAIVFKQKAGTRRRALRLEAGIKAISKKEKEFFLKKGRFS